MYSMPSLSLAAVHKHYHRKMLSLSMPTLYKVPTLSLSFLYCDVKVDKVHTTLVYYTTVIRPNMFQIRKVNRDGGSLHYNLTIHYSKLNALLERINLPAFR